MKMMAAEPAITQLIGTSHSIREASPDCPALSARTFLSPVRNAERIVGSVRSKVINPAAATAPAAIGRM